MTTPATELLTAACRAREIGDPLHQALAEWLDTEAATWAGDEVHAPCSTTTCTLDAALVVARQVLGTTTGQPEGAPAALSEVWTVWREDEPVYAHFATEDAARQGTIDCWQEAEPSCPDYSWRPDGPRLELVVGGEHGGVYASRHRVYGTPETVTPAVDRAAILHEAAEAVLDIIGTDARLPQTISGVYRASDHLRRLADEAQQPAPAVDLTETAGNAARRFARRLVAVERLCSGRPGYHTVTVKQLLTAMSDTDDDEPTPAPAEEPTR